MRYDLSHIRCRARREAIQKRHPAFHKWRHQDRARRALATVWGGVAAMPPHLAAVGLSPAAAR